MATSPNRLPADTRVSLSWRILVPGWSHWSRQECERARVLFGTFAASLVVGLFAWGSRPGFAMLVLAFLVHVFSATQVIQTSAFPGFARWIPCVTASFGLGLGCYLPTLVVASLLAWPDQPSGRSLDRYLINRWAYSAREPETGDWIWHEMPDGRGFGLGRLIAGPGQTAEWSGNRLRVDGTELSWTPDASGGNPIDMAMTVPEGHLLVAPDQSQQHTRSSLGLSLVPRPLVVGRPWARSYPIWSRRFLY